MGEVEDQTVRILLLEDSALDAELIRENLRESGLVHVIDRVMTRDAYLQAIDGRCHDLILADYLLPSFDGLSAMAIARERCPDVPFIFVSGILGEEVAVEALKNGATDFVLKHNLARLPGTVRRAMAEARERLVRRQAEEALHALNQTLEQRIAERTGELAEANRRLTAEVEERRRVQAALAESEARYRAIVAHSPDAIFVIGVLADGRLVCETGNPAATPLIDPADHGSHLDGLSDACFLRIYGEQIRRCITEGAPVSFDGSFGEGPGEVQERETVLVPIVDHDGRVVRVVGTSRDVTARKRAEDALRQAQKMEAVGQLTSGVAHDFNNLLAVIAGNLDIAARRVDDAFTQERLRRGLQAAERAAKLTQQLLAFARRQPLMPSVIDIGERVQAMGEMLGRTLGPHIEVEAAVDPDLWPTRLDPNQFELAVLNVAVNARDAMPDGGKLKIRVTNQSVHRFGPVEALSDGVMLSVTDTGTGIPPEVLDRVFEPFFTTKEPGRGTGLGLSMVYGFAQQSNGFITMDSLPGHGTTVAMFFPRVDGVVQRESEEDQAFAPGRGRFRVLVVEDNPEVGELTETLLREIGHDVLRASDANEALTVLAARAREIDLVVTDVMMPGTSGLELARRAGNLYPDLPIVLTTGFSEAAARGEAEGYPLLLKPFTPSSLESTVRSHARAAGIPVPD